MAIVLLVDDSATRDAFFAAYSCYLPFVLWAASVRGSLIPLSEFTEARPPCELESRGSLQRSAP